MEGTEAQLVDGAGIQTYVLNHSTPVFLRQPSGHTGWGWGMVKLSRVLRMWKCLETMPSGNSRKA